MTAAGTRDRSSLLAATRGPLPPGWTAHYAPVVSSTQDVARAAARAGAASRSLFVADEQTAGRGRQGRRWMAPPGSALLFSALFREQAPTPAPWRYTTLLSVALAEAIRAVSPTLEPRIKWPNDLLLGERKVAGVLAEAAWDGGRLVVVVGAGVNVGMDAATLARVGPAATSLRVAAGRAVDRGELFLALVGRLDAWLQRPPRELHAAWLARLWGRGQRLRLADVDARDEEVVVLGADVDGSLRIRRADGSEARTTTGEIIL